MWSAFGEAIDEASYGLQSFFDLQAEVRDSVNGTLVNYLNAGSWATASNFWDAKWKGST